MLTFINSLNLAIFIVFTAVYFYRSIYMLVALISKRRRSHGKPQGGQHKYAVIIAARNEQEVIPELIKSIQNQHYPQELVDVFVVADNCTDETAKVSRDAGAIVYERNNLKQIGKGYALNHMLGIIDKDYADKGYEGFFVFDADNVLDEHFISEMNKMFDRGCKVLTSYRNSKNYNSNWISAGYALWFLHEAEFLNNPRMILNKSCAVSGTGFLIHKDIIKENGGWVHYLLTEDIEFSVSEVIKGQTIGYCRTAVLYDEQPCSFKQSWKQRLRWAKGFYQVFGRYGKDLFKSIFQRGKQNFSCYDILMTVMPAMLVTVASVAINAGFFIAGLLNPKLGPEILYVTFSAILSSFCIYYGILFLIGLITTITEWKRIYCASWEKILYIFTFPVFMLTYVPIAIVALFKKVEWQPIKHTFVKSVHDIR